ncbi:aminotransferase class III-fold pyridoxal phosphate-dependent enzyme [Membranihabitans maritimus]|uniref:aminotransferase class III-fold pyridoxal phosphate-dependent enzyme n=1 Tax=Membranihabitans maritimus TaxID=2904244 RepID=UPI001F027261|nr:aminotransferase class III-fold pyridoxal phosphate-dependent enzyme [Membranihabitans maritimus]
MRFNKEINRTDEHLITKEIKDFVPSKVFDIHGHLYNSLHYKEGSFSWLEKEHTLGLREYKDSIKRTIGHESIQGLFFGMPHKSGKRKEIDAWILNEIKSDLGNKNYGLKLVSPDDDPTVVAEELNSRKFIGIKVYHVYADRADTMNASITEYAPEWMWELLHDIGGVIMLHIVREQGIADQNNQDELRRLSRKYGRVKIILAHVARSFNYRTGQRGLEKIFDLENVFVDTSAICEKEAFSAAIKSLGPNRILWGSDFPVSEMRGRCVTTGEHFFWLHPEILKKGFSAPTSTQMTLVGIESLMALKEACEIGGLSKADINNIFFNNAINLLDSITHTNIKKEKNTGSDLWKEARKVIAGGTGLMSKRSEMFDEENWPAYYSKCKGCEVWDLDGRKFIDFVGGVGSIMLGYADPDVNASVTRRMSMGSYCSLINPDEVILAKELLKLHPWAEGGKVKFARTGGESMSIAIRIARAKTGNSGIAFCGYHGWHDWYLAANIGETSALDGHLIPGLEPTGVPRELKGTSAPFKYNDLESFDNAIDQHGSNLAAVVMEPMRSQYPDPNFIEHIVRTCRDKGIILIVDEITSGLRYGYPGAHMNINLHPDIVVYAKAMSNGYPFGAIVGKKEVMEGSENSFISSSYWTDGVGTSAALAVLNKIQELNIQATLWKKGEAFQKQLKELAQKYPECEIKIGGMPVSPTMTFLSGEHSQIMKVLFIRKMLKQGFLVSSLFYLMHAHQEEHIRKLLISMDAVLCELNDMVINGEIENEVFQNKNNKKGFARLA